MTPEQIQKMAEGFPPSSIGKDHEEVIVWLAEQHVALQEQVLKLVGEVQGIKWVVLDVSDDDYASANNHCQRLMGEIANFKTPETDAVIREIGAKAVDSASDELKQLAKRSDPASSEHIHAAALYLMLISKQLRAGEVS